MWLTQQPRKVLLEQLNSLVSTSDEALPESLIIIDSNDWQGQVSLIHGIQRCVALSVLNKTMDTILCWIEIFVTNCVYWHKPSHSKSILWLAYIFHPSNECMKLVTLFTLLTLMKEPVRYLAWHRCCCCSFSRRFWRSPSVTSSVRARSPTSRRPSPSSSARFRSCEWWFASVVAIAMQYVVRKYL